jgi:hypothetical protein
MVVETLAPVNAPLNPTGQGDEGDEQSTEELE